MTILASTGLEYIGVIDAAIVALLGYVVVFFGLILLMCVVIAIGKLFTAIDNKKAAKNASALAQKPEEEEVSKPFAPGSAGQLKLHNVDPKTAAMLMAIVADKIGKPINELRFISIKEAE